MRRLLPLALFFFACPKPSTSSSASAPTSAPAKAPQSEERLAKNHAEGYELRFPPGWRYELRGETVELAGERLARKVLVASWGEPTKAFLTVQVRDHFLDGEDLFARDFPSWFEELSRQGALLTEPSVTTLKGKHAGLRIGLELQQGGSATHLERIYLYAPGPARAYLVTFQSSVADYPSFREQLSLLIAQLAVVPPEGDPYDDASCRAALKNLREARRVAKEISCLRLIGVPEQGASAWWLALGSAYDRAGLEAEALDAYQSATKSAEPDSLYRARLARGRLLREKGSFAEAAAEYRAALDAKPGAKDAVFGLGLSLHLGGDPKGAIELYRAWLQAQPADHEVKESLALALEDTGDFKEAARLWNEALAVRRVDPSAEDNALWIDKGEKALTRLKEKAERRGR